MKEFQETQNIIGRIILEGPKMGAVVTSGRRSVG